MQKDFMITRLFKPIHQALFFYYSHSYTISNDCVDFKTQFFYIIILQMIRLRRKTSTSMKRPTRRTLRISPSMPHPILVETYRCTWCV